MADAGYGGVAFVGDLPGRWHQRLHETAAAMATVPLPAAIVLGNHDGPTAAEVLAEALCVDWLDAARLERARSELIASLGPIRELAWSWTTLGDVVVLGARPHAMGRRLSFPRWLATRGIVTEDHAVDALVEAGRAAPAGPLLVLAHNGPSGLGDDGRAPWSLPWGGDLGDRDLRRALTALRGLRPGPIAVVAGHVHRRVGDGRRWLAEFDGLLAVNVARFPRHEQRGDGVVAHHVALEVADGRWVAEARQVPLNAGRGRSDG